jgi:toxin ParE1/3/4
MKIRHTRRSLEDISISIEWYEKQLQGLGLDFLECVEDALKRISNNPNIYAQHHKQFRRILLRKFPFSVFFSIEPNEIVIHAVFDNRKNPEKLP